MMSDREFEALFVLCGDPLGALRDFTPIRCRDIAPTFCGLFGHNIYMVRKYVRSEYPILPERTIGNPSDWLFHPGGPRNQDDIIELERKIGATSYFPPLSGEPTYQRLARIERVLRWINANNLRTIPIENLAGIDLSGIDNTAAECIVAYLACHCGNLMPLNIQFLKAQNKKSPDILIESDDCKVAIEVKHILKFPQSELEGKWVEAVTRQRRPKPSKMQEQLASEMDKKLDSSAEDSSVGISSFFWQKHVGSIGDQLWKANEQLACAPNGYEKVIVLHSDDPHVFTTDEERNRIEQAVDAFMADQKRTVDSVVILGNQRGFPVINGYCSKIYPNTTSLCRRLFGSLPTLQVGDIRPYAIGIKTTIQPFGTKTVSLRIE